MVCKRQGVKPKSALFPVWIHSPFSPNISWQLSPVNSLIKDPKNAWLLKKTSEVISGFPFSFFLIIKIWPSLLQQSIWVLNICHWSPWLLIIGTLLSPTGPQFDIYQENICINVVKSISTSSSLSPLAKSHTLDYTESQVPKKIPPIKIKTLIFYGRENTKTHWSVFVSPSLPPSSCWFWPSRLVRDSILARPCHREPLL